MSAKVKSFEDIRNIPKDELRYKGRGQQILIYLGKLFRMFVFQSDWKVLPMAAVIAGLVCYVVGANLFKNMEGTLLGTFAMSCICIWNGFFNSIQVICRERAIIKREHRAGMHISSYIAAHMIYQAFLCLGQTVVTLSVCRLMKVAFPTNSLVTGSAMLDMAITIFLTTYASDMMSLMTSAIVRSTTTAMTVMPFLMIFQLVFSGGFFSLEGTAQKITNLTVAKWGLTAFCAQGNYNDLPMVSLWKTMNQMKNVEYEGMYPVKTAMDLIEQSGGQEQLMLECAKYNQNPKYESSMDNVLNCWLRLILFIVLFACIAVGFLEYIDKDKR
ncbi:MAG: ABC transporter permease [Lachnospiraceae bacterium]|nr:ABC transporter permease [Lachnospiraceae bacterium]MBR3736666.1 ABC transporter permease [Lachnospiraceae bacterium]MBR6155551.1 ABC transporter permease [Lachnospiraceae bacterium]